MFSLKQRLLQSLLYFTLSWGIFKEQRINVLYLEANCTSLVKDLGKDFTAPFRSLPVFHDSFCFVWRPNPPYAAQHHLFYLPVSLLLLHFNPRAPYSLRIPFPKAHSKPRLWVKGEVVDCERRRLVYRAPWNGRLLIQQSQIPHRLKGKSFYLKEER